MLTSDALSASTIVGSTTVAVTRSPSSNHVEVTFTAPATPGQLARFSGVLTLCDLDIVWATIRVRGDEVCDTFECAPIDRDCDPNRIGHHVNSVLEDVLAGRVNLRTVLAERQRAAGPLLDVTPAVEIDTDSELTTGIRVRTVDRRGLLYDLASTITEHGLRTRSITVLTVAGLARDTFRVVDRQGLPPREPHSLEALRSALHGACR